MQNNLSASKVAQQLDISTYTLTNWYKWQETCRTPEHDFLPVLPQYQQRSTKGIRYWKQEDIPIIQQFKDSLPKGRGGVMGNYNAKFWGERGKRDLSNKPSQKV